MGRAALKWGVRELADRTGLTANTISRVENGAESLAGTLQKIQDALESAGLDFLPEHDGAGAGVRLSRPAERG